MCIYFEDEARGGKFFHQSLGFDKERYKEINTGNPIYIAIFSLISA